MNNLDFIKDAANQFKSFNFIYKECDKQKVVGVEGTYELRDILIDNKKKYEETFYIKIIYDEDSIIPKVYLPNENIPKSFCHYYRNNGECCLGLNYEIIKEWGADKKAERFFDNIIDIYLMNLIEFRNTTEYIDGERPHGEKGVIDYYRNLFNLDKCSDENVKNILSMICSKVKKYNLFKGHQLCICGSGKKLRKCHQKTFNNFINDVLKNDDYKEAFYKDLSVIRGIKIE